MEATALWRRQPSGCFGSVKFARLREHRRGESTGLQSASVIRSFADQATEDIFDGAATRAARQRCPPRLWRVVHRICFVWEPGYADDVEITDYH